MSFGIAIPGRPVSSEFVGDGNGRFFMEISSPGEIADFCLFLSTPLQAADHGIAVYYFAAGWQFIGALSNARPTVILNPGWSLNPEINLLPSVRIMLSYEPAASIVIQIDSKPEDFRKIFAKKVALNLFHFMESVGGVVTVRDLDRWMSKFEQKFQRDPNFVLKAD